MVGKLMRIGAGVSCTRVRQPLGTGPALRLSITSVAENTAQGVTVGTATPLDAVNPGNVTIASQSITNALAMTGDGVSFAVGAGAASLNYESAASFIVTFQYTDDNGTYTFPRLITILDVDDGPTISGASTDLDTMLGSPVAGTQVSGDLDNLFVSPTGQTMTYTVSNGVVGVGNAWTWTPPTAGAVTVSITATDQDGQSLTIEKTIDVTAANNAPVAANITLTFVVPPPAATAPPVNTVAPVLSGTTQVGQTLSTSTGTWTGDVTIVFTYAWERSDNGTSGWAPISAATANTYTLVAADDTKYIRCAVTGTNGVGNSTANTSSSAQVLYPVPVNTVVPVVTGTPTDGQTLTSTDGTWDNLPTSYTRKWQVSDDGSTGWSDIGGATSSTYVLATAQVGKYVRSQITAINSGGSTASQSAATTQIQAIPSGLAGLDTVYEAIKSTATASSYSGSITQTTGELILMEIVSLADSAGTDTANWVVTSDGNTLTRTPSTGNATTTTQVSSTMYHYIAGSTGTVTLSVNTSGTSRALAAHYRRITGHDAVTPIQNSNSLGTQSSDVTTITVPNAQSTAANGNAIVSAVGVKGGTSSAYGVTGVDSNQTAGNTGTNASNDVSFCSAAKMTPTAAAVSHVYTWTGANRVRGMWAEVKKA